MATASVNRVYTQFFKEHWYWDGHVDFKQTSWANHISMLSVHLFKDNTELSTLISHKHHQSSKCSKSILTSQETLHQPSMCQFQHTYSKSTPQQKHVCTHHNENMLALIPTLTCSHSSQQTHVCTHSNNKHVCTRHKNNVFALIATEQCLHSLHQTHVL